jgi:hypothetical protein
MCPSSHQMISTLYPSLCLTHPLWSTGQDFTDPTVKLEGDDVIIFAYATKYLSTTDGQFTVDVTEKVHTQSYMVFTHKAKVAWPTHVGSLIWCSHMNLILLYD